MIENSALKTFHKIFQQLKELSIWFQTLTSVFELITMISLVFFPLKPCGRL